MPLIFLTCYTSWTEVHKIKHMNEALEVPGFMCAHTEWEINASITRNIWTTVLALKREVFWDVTQCWPLDSHGTFERSTLLWRLLTLKPINTVQNPRKLNSLPTLLAESQICLVFTYFCFTTTVLSTPWTTEP